MNRPHGRGRTAYYSPRGDENGWNPTSGCGAEPRTSDLLPGYGWIFPW